MRREGTVGAHARRKWRRGRRDTAPAPDQRWVADITEFATDDGTLYLAGILDLCDHTCVGWSMRERATTDLVIDAPLSTAHPDRSSYVCQGLFRRCWQTSDGPLGVEGKLL